MKFVDYLDRFIDAVFNGGSEFYYERMQETSEENSSLHSEDVQLKGVSSQFAEIFDSIYKYKDKK